MGGFGINTNNGTIYNYQFARDNPCAVGDGIYQLYNAKNGQPDFRSYAPYTKGSMFGIYRPGKQIITKIFDILPGMYVKFTPINMSTCTMTSAFNTAYSGVIETMCNGNKGSGWGMLLKITLYDKTHKVMDSMNLFIGGHH